MTEGLAPARLLRKLGGCAGGGHALRQRFIPDLLRETNVEHDRQADDLRACLDSEGVFIGIRPQIE